MTRPIRPTRPTLPPQTSAVDVPAARTKAAIPSQPNQTPHGGRELASGLRRQPAQARGLATFEHLLVAAASVLETEGIEGLNTNRIAAESQTNVSSIYKYFSNKHAILAALFERQNHERVNSLRGLLEEFGTATDWRKLVDKAVDRVAQSRRSTPGSMALRRAMRSSPDLAALDQKANADLSAWLGGQLQRLTGLPPRRAKVVARMMVELEVALLDWWETPEVSHDAEILRETKAVLKAYLAVYAKGPADA